MSYQITVKMPDSQDVGRRQAAVSAIAAKTAKPFSVLFVEAPREAVECHGKGVGQRTLERWTAAVRVALKRGRAALHPKPTAVHFRWMGAFWSCSASALAEIESAIANDQPFNLYQLGAKELKSRPKGTCRVLRDSAIRHES